MTETFSEEDKLSLLDVDTGPDMGTGTATVARGARVTLADPTIVVSPDVRAKFMVAETGWRLVLVTDM